MDILCDSPFIAQTPTGLNYLSIYPRLGMSTALSFGDGCSIPRMHGAFLGIQGGGPPVISWFIIPINYRYNPLINPSYWTYKPT